MATPAAISSRLAAYTARWQAMPTRDRRALAALAAFFVLVGGWLLVVKPVIGYAKSGRDAYAQAQADLAWMQANAVAARMAGASGTSASAQAGQSLLTVVNASAQAAGITLQRFEPESGGQRVRVTLENAAFTDTLRWLVTLERDHGLVVETFNADPQAQPGRVNVRLTLGRAT